MAARVFVIQEQPKHNLAPALKYGELVVLLPNGDANFSVDTTLMTLRERLADFDQATDWLLLTGDPIAIALASTVISYSVDRLKFLKWDRQERVYIPIICDISSL